LGRVREPTYYVQFASPEEIDRAEVRPSRSWHTIARVSDRMLADEMARLAETSYMRTTSTPTFVGRAISRSALKREGGWHHAEWELGIGTFRDYGEALRERGQRNLYSSPGAPVVQ
jgi:hypothetical protein